MNARKGRGAKFKDSSSCSLPLHAFANACKGREAKIQFLALSPYTHLRMRVRGEKLKSLGPVPLHAFANACKGREAKILSPAPLPLHAFAGMHGEESGELLAFFCLQTGDFGNLGKFPIFHGTFDTI